MEPSGVDFKKYLQLVAKRKYVFIVSVLSLITLVVLTSYFLPRQYEAKCTVFIERNMINAIIKGIAITPSLEERLKVLSYTMSSRNLLLKVADDLGFQVNRKDQSAVERVISDFQKNTDIKMKSENGLFIVSYRNTDPHLARDYVNALVRRYIEENVSEKREETYGASRFLAEQIKFFKEKLDKADEEIIKFRKEKGIFVALDDRRVVEEIKTAEEGLEEVRIKRRELEARKRMMLKQMKGERPYTATILGKGAGDPGERILALQRRLTDLLLTYTANYPEVIRVRAEIEALKGQMESGQALAGGDMQNPDTEVAMLNPVLQQLREELTKTDLELAALTAKDEQLRRLMESKKTYLRSMPAEKKNLTDLEMARTTTKNIYEELVARLGQSEVSKQMEIQDKASTFRVVDPAVLPLKPVSPDRVKIMLFGMFAGLAGGFGLVVLLDSMDRSVKTVDSLKSFGVPVIAVIPSIQNPDEMEERQRKDMRLYKFAGAYMACILVVFTMELLGMSYIDDLISAVVHLPGHLKSIF